MLRRWLRSWWWWLAVCVVVCAAAVAVMDLLVLREGLALADAFAAGAGEKPGAPRRHSVSILFGLFDIRDTSHPYAWFALGSAVTGAALGLAVWCVVRVVAWVWQRVRRPSAGGPAVPGAAPEGGRV